MAPHQVYLTRRNLLVLLSKLDRKAKGEDTSCMIVKGDVFHKDYPCDYPTAIIAVEDEDYYTDREPGDVHHRDQPDGRGKAQ